MARNRERPLTFQQKLCAAIDTALEKQPAGLADFLSMMEQSGYEVKQQRGVISFRAPGQDFKRILGGAKLPKMDELKEEGRKLAEKKKKLYAEYSLIYLCTNQENLRVYISKRLLYS